MAVEKELRFRVSAIDDTTQRTKAISQAVGRDMRQIGKDVDDTRSKVDRFADGLEQAADTIEDELKGLVRASDLLADKLGTELAARADPQGLIQDWRKAGLTFEEIEGNVDRLAAAVQRMDDVGQETARSLDASFDRVDDGLGRVHSEADQSRSVLANMVGNSTQDLGQLGGVAGTAGVAIGQLGEYAADGNIKLRNLIGLAAGMVVLGVAVKGVADHMERIKEVDAFRTDRADAFFEALQDGSDVAEVLLNNLRETGKVEFAFGDEGMGDLSSQLLELGLSIEDFTRLAGLSEEQIHAWGRAQVAAGADAGTVGLVMVGLVDTHDRLTEAEERNRVTQDLLGDSTRNLGDRSGVARAQVDLLAAATERAQQAASDAADELARANDELSDLFDISDSLPVIEDNMAEALRDAADEARGLAEANASGSDRFSAFLDMVQGSTGTLEDFIARRREEGDTTEEAAEKANDYIDELFDLAGQYGLTEQQANDLRTEMGLLPDQVTTTVNAVGVAETDAYLSAIAQHMAELDGMQATIQLRNEQFTTIDGKPLDLSWMNAGRRPGQKFADGGTVQGPKGAEVDVTAHAGEIILNEAQQRNVADGLGGAMDTSLIESLLEEQNRLQRQLLSTLGDFVPRLSPRPARS